MSDKSELIKNLGSFPKFGQGICFARLAVLLEQLQLTSFIEQTPKLAITGSNGKGSVARITNAILSEAGLNTGLFTSPHFLEFNERYLNMQTEVDYALLNRTLQQMFATIRRVEQQTREQFGVFEVLFVLAIAVFKTLQTNFLVFEAGIGGRYDPVRLLKSSLTVLTTVDLEHSELLGTSKELIAYDKMDACANGGKVVLGNIAPKLVTKLEAFGELNQIEVIVSGKWVSVEPDKRDTVAKSGQNTWWVTEEPYAPFRLTTPLQGEFAKYNLETSMFVSNLVLKHLTHEQRAVIYQNAVANLTVPGRLQMISQAPPILVDSAHTEQSYQILFASLRKDFPKQKLVFLIGQSEGREPQALIDGLKQLASCVIVTKASHKGANPNVLYDHLELHHVEAEKYADLNKALTVALKRREERDCLLVVCGSLFLAGEVNAIIKGQDNKNLFLY
ncbi:MAG: hypothetical protein GJ680_12080 [Alteromonadaceae bacterium]|nr:hypothetical protein [Alteromonadaceae bacterium]